MFVEKALFQDLVNISGDGVDGVGMRGGRGWWGSIFITGAASGMGRLAARNYAEDGYEVAAVDIDEHGLLETAENHQNILIFSHFLHISILARIANISEESPTLVTKFTSTRLLSLERCRSMSTL